MPCPATRPWNGGFWYRLPSGHTCCSANSVGADPHGWYLVAIRGTSVSGGIATVRFSLAIRNVFANNAWRYLRWSELSRMHGRRVHISAVSEDLQFAWHVHLDEGTIAQNAQEFSATLKLPAAFSARVRLLFNFGVLSEDVDLCVDESAVHIDPGPGGQELVVEGQALSPPRWKPAAAWDGSP